MTTKTNVPLSVKQAGRRMIWYGYMLPIATYVLVVLLSPTNVLDLVPIFKILTDALHSALLGVSSAIDIYRHARTTSFVQVAMLASSLSVVLVVWITLASWLQTALHFRALRTHMQRTVNQNGGRAAGLFALPAFGLFCWWAFFCLAGDPSFAAGLTTSGRLGYLCMSSVAIFFAGGGLGQSLMHFRLLLTRKAETT